MKTYKKIYLIVTIILAIFILYFSIVKTNEPTGTIKGYDKIKHVLAYFLLSVCFYKFVDNKKLSFLIIGSYGLLIELIQLNLPYRQFSFLDVLANYLGAGLIIIIKQNTKTRKR